MLPKAGWRPLLLTPALSEGDVGRSVAQSFSAAALEGETLSHKQKQNGALFLKSHRECPITSEAIVHMAELGKKGWGPDLPTEVNLHNQFFFRSALPTSSPWPRPQGSEENESGYRNTSPWERICK